VPTYEWVSRFRRDFEALSPDEQRAFVDAVRQFVEDMKAGGPFRPGLRVKGVRGARGVFEMTWAPDGRATFEYGDSIQDGEPHVIWRRVGTHDILGAP
jgi:hypothetical protein